MALNHKMADKHEGFLSSLFGGRRTKGSGNQWHNPMDGRTSRMHTRHAFAWDGKATLGKSIGVTREMWEKAIEQSGGERPMLALRWYDNERLDVGLDLALVNAHDLAELIEVANGLAFTTVEIEAPSGGLNGIRTTIDGKPVKVKVDIEIGRDQHPIIRIDDGRVLRPTRVFRNGVLLAIDMGILAD